MKEWDKTVVNQPEKWHNKTFFMAQALYQNDIKSP